MVMTTTPSILLPLKKYFLSLLETASLPPHRALGQ